METNQNSFSRRTALKAGAFLAGTSLIGFKPAAALANITVAKTPALTPAEISAIEAAIGVFAASAAESVVYDCAHAQAAGYRCVMTKANDSLLTADLKKLGKDSCTVKESRSVGKTQKGTAFVEVNCSDGLAGYMIEYSLSPKLEPLAVTGCAFAKGIGGGCKLAGNM
mgnify:CR=1 FL=1